MKKYFPLLCFTFLLFSSVAGAHSIVVGAYTINIVTKPGSAAGEEIADISYSPYEVYQHVQWQMTRYDYRIERDPLGARPYWDLPIPEIIPPGWEDYASLRQETVFHAQLSSKSALQWSRLFFADKLVRSFLLERGLAPFLRAHESEMIAADTALETSLGKPIGLYQFNEAPLTKRDQFAFHEAAQFIGSHSTVLRWGDFASAVGDFSNLALIKPRIPKQSIPDEPIKAHPLLVVHASNFFDREETAASGINKLIATFKRVGRPVIFLMNDPGDGDLWWYTQDRQPTYALYSDGGEHNITLDAPEVTVVGGFLGDKEEEHGCHFKAMVDAISRYFLRHQGRFRVNLPLAAIYSYDDDAGTISDFLKGKLAEADFISYAQDNLFFTEDPDSLGTEDLTSSIGVLTTKQYTFEFWVNGVLKSKRGVGQRIVEFNFIK